MRSAFVIVGIAGAAVAGNALAGTPDSDRAYAAELKADAGARASALESAAGLADGETTVKLGGWAQFRYYMNFRDDQGDALPHQSGFTNGFESTRTRLNAAGSVMSKDLTYKIEGEFNKSTGAFGLLDAYVDWKYENGITARAGQFKAPLLREELVGDTYQLLANRGLVNEIFSQKRTQGIQGGWKNEQFALRGSLNDGLNTLNTDFNNSKESDFAATFRADFKGGGDWKVFDDFTGWRGQDLAWLVGAAAHYQHDGNTSSSGSAVQRQVIEYTVDFSVEGNGWNLFAMGVGRHIDPDASGAKSLDDFGIQIQGGVFVSNNAELFGAWDGVFVDKDYGAGKDKDFHALTFGSNVYLFEKSHAAKFTAQVSWFLNTPGETAPVSALASSNNLGLLPDVSDNQVALILQFQFMF